MMERKRNTGHGFDDWFDRMGGEERCHGADCAEGFGGPRHPHGPGRGHADGCERYGMSFGGFGRCGHGGMRSPHEAFRDLQGRFGEGLRRFAHMRRGVFDPHAFRDDAFEAETKDVEGEYVVEVRLPGLARDAIRLERLPGMLLLRAGEAAERPLFLGQCDEEGIRARYRDGVLEIRIPKVVGQVVEIA